MMYSKSFFLLCATGVQALSASATRPGLRRSNSAKVAPGLIIPQETKDEPALVRVEPGHDDENNCTVYKIYNSSSGQTPVAAFRYSELKPLLESLEPSDDARAILNQVPCHCYMWTSNCLQTRAGLFQAAIQQIVTEKQLVAEWNSGNFDFKQTNPEFLFLNFFDPHGGEEVRTILFIRHGESESNKNKPQTRLKRDWKGREGQGWKEGLGRKLLTVYRALMPSFLGGYGRDTDITREQWRRIIPGSSKNQFCLNN